MHTLEEARSIIASSTAPLPPERIPLERVLGAVLREDVRAPEEFPLFDRSAMDGYAIADSDPAERFRVVIEVQPGAIPTVSLGAGECARIFTGAAIPPGADRVVMQEYAARDGEWVTFSRRDGPAHIRRRGEDARAGDLLLPAGRTLRPGDLAMLAQIGCTEPQASRRARVLHLVTGGELVPPTQRPAPGQIRDSNSTLVAALLAGVGADVVAHRRQGDDAQALRGAIESVPAEEWDALLISGGASVGDYDFGRRVLQELGFELKIAGVQLRPGKPLVFGVRGRQIAFVIPGNPVSHFVVFHTAIRLAFERLAGREPAWDMLAATLAAEIPEQKDRRETYWPAALEFRGQAVAQPLPWQSSGDLRGLLGANALLHLPGGSASIPAGGSVQCLLL